MSGPVGSVALGVALGRLVRAEQGGMADLAALVLGLMVGGAALALVVFAACLRVLVRPGVARPLVAVAVMLAACTANLAVTMLGLVVVGRGGGSAAIIVPVFVAASVAVLAAGAALALRAGSPRARPQAGSVIA